MNEYNNNNKSPLPVSLALTILGCMIAFLSLGGCATAQQQTEVANLRFLVEEVGNLGDSFDGLFD